MSEADQRLLITQLYSRANAQGLGGEFGDQIWEMWRDGENSTIQGYEDI